MSAPKLTRIFPGYVKPVHVGVYRVLRNPRRYTAGYAYWNGKRWGVSFLDAVAAAKGRPHFKFADQEKSWRGLAVKP